MPRSKTALVRLTRWTGIAILVLAAVAGLAGLAWWAGVPRLLLENAFSTRLGLPVRIGANPILQLQGSRLAVTIRDLEVGVGKERPPVFTAPELTAVIRWRTWLETGRLTITSLDLQRPSLLLPLPKLRTSGQPGTVSWPQRVAIRDGRLRWPMPDGTKLALDAVNLAWPAVGTETGRLAADWRLGAHSGVARVQGRYGTGASGKAAWRDLAGTLTEAGPGGWQLDFAVPALYRQGAQWRLPAFMLRLQRGAGTARLTGAASLNPPDSLRLDGLSLTVTPGMAATGQLTMTRFQPPEIAAEWSLRVPDIPAFARAWELPLPKLARPAALGPLQMAGAFSQHGGAWNLAIAHGRLKNSTFAGDLAGGGTEPIRLHLTVDRLDLGDFLSAPKTGGGALTLPTGLPLTGRVSVGDLRWGRIWGKDVTLTIGAGTPP